MHLDARDGDRFEQFTRRAAILGVGTAGLFTMLAGRLYYLQVLENQEYKMMADDNYLNRRLIAPLRGRVLDRFGIELATNRQNFRVVLIPEATKDIDATLDALSPMIDLTDEKRAWVKKEARRRRKFFPITVAENLSWEAFAKVNVNLPIIPGVQPDVGEARDYPFTNQLSHVIGYVAKASEEDVAADSDAVLQLPEFRIGKSGLERTFDKELRGSAGARQVEVNAFGREIRELNRDKGLPGDDMVLTLDMGVQSFVYERLEGQSGSVIVMDVNSGDIIALASTPAFDPNAFRNGLSQKVWDGLRNDKMKPLMDKSVSGLFSPGSTFKVITALAALESGLVDPMERVYCGGKTRLGRRDFHCWKKQGHGWMDMRNGIKNSCNVYFYDLARKIGIERMADMAKKFGLGQTFDIGVPGQKEGLVPTGDWKQAIHGEPWVTGDTFNTAIGQGFLLTTPLQLAVMISRIANGGKSVVPRLVNSVGATQMPGADSFEDLGLDPEWMVIIHDGMTAVMNEWGGTARGSRLWGDGMSMAGKTGTVQIRRITKEERAAGVIKNDQLPWERRDHGWFMGFGPYDNPKYAIAVLIEHGGGGSSAAAPVARDIMRYVQTADPSGQPGFDILAAAPKTAPDPTGDGS